MKYFNLGLLVVLCASCVNAETVNIADIGAICDGDIANADADTLALKSAVALYDEVYVPAGTCRINETIAIKRPIRLSGPSGTLSADHPATLFFPDGIPGIIVHAKNTNSDSVGNVTIEGDTTSGAGTIIENLFIRATTKYPVPDGSSHGIWLKSRALLRDVHVSMFAGNNINIVASASSADPIVTGNANNFSVENSRSTNSGGDGIFIDGADANTGYTLNFSAVSNNGWGLYDSSFLGNTHISAHVSSNGAGPYKADSNNAANAFIGCYTEGGQEYSIISPSIVIGGFMNPDADSTAMRIVSGKISGFKIDGHKNSARDIAVSFVPAKDELMEFQADGDHVRGLSIYWNEVDGVWELRHARVVSRKAQQFTTDITNIYAGRQQKLGGGNVIFPNGYFLGPSNGARHQTTLDSPPTAGESAKGDIVYNRDPDPGEFMGWTCVVAGNPCQSWKGFGLIEN